MTITKDSNLFITDIKFSINDAECKNSIISLKAIVNNNIVLNIQRFIKKQIQLCEVILYKRVFEDVYDKYLYINGIKDESFDVQLNDKEELAMYIIMSTLSYVL